MMSNWEELKYCNKKGYRIKKRKKWQRLFSASNKIEKIKKCICVSILRKM